jgi:polysaccharide transporter, PST family
LPGFGYGNWHSTTLLLGWIDVPGFKKYLSHSVFRNALALYSVQFAEYLVPMITVPYLARVLQPTGWGLVVYAQNFSLWLILVMEYGFGFSATREVARHRNDPGLHAEVASGVLGANLLLLMPAIVIAFIAGFKVPAFHDHPAYLWLALATAIPQGLRPFWYFQGIEAMQLPSWVNVGGRVLVAIGIFILVKSSSHGWIVLTLQAVVGGFVSVVIALAMYRRIQFLVPTLARSFEALKRGWAIFLSRSAVGLYTLANTFILGFFTTSDQVAYYGGAERLVLIVLGLMTPLCQALYPRMSHLAHSDRGRATDAVKLSLVAFAVLGLVLGGALIAAAPLVVRYLLGPSYRPAISIMRVASLSIPFAAVSNILGMQWMLPFGMDRAFNRIVVCAGILNVALAVSLAPRFGPIGTAWSVVASQAFVTTAMAIFLFHTSRRDARKLTAEKVLTD